MVRYKTFNKMLRYFDNNLEKTQKWFNTPHHLLDGIKPKDLANMGKHTELERFVIEISGEV